ncbi:MAG: hypothetical protein C4338_04575 [Rhodanobacteraceae bacterium]
MRRSLRAILLSIPIWLSCVSSADALNSRLPFRAFVLDNCSVEQGLPQITSLSIAQDRTGYLWIATQLAIARFDGVRFTTFDRAAAGVDTSTNSASWADGRDQVWFGGAQGLLRERGGRFTALGGGAINAIIDGGDGAPLLATMHGLARVAQDRIVPVDGFQDTAFSLLREGGTLWIGGAGKLCRLALSSRKSNCIALPEARGEQTAVTHLARAYGTLWLGTHAGLFRLDGDRIVSAWLAAELQGTPIESLYADRDGVLWISTVNVLFRDLPGGALEKISDADLTRDPWLHAMFEDRDGNLWLGSHTEGLYRMWNGWARRVSARDGLTDPFVWSVVHAPGGEILFGTNSDVDRFDGQLAHLLVAGSALPNPSVYELYFDRRNRMWIGTRAGIAIYDHGKIVAPLPLAALAPWQINDIHRVGDDDFWIGTSGGLYRWCDGVLSRADPAAGVAAARIRSILVLSPEHLRIGTEDGVREWRERNLSELAWAAPLHGHFVSRLAWLQPGLQWVQDDK